ncbi:hypothetical protein CERSUDRAFT_108718 [Gelatoporia subvermispora B]|uniref:Uncharacterized protein n=1 Tax=Ceriporiopsis subvermispora (strain B) TaxID=914234 RepID=M2Q6Y9_CERS8|nr:hypothetical protein CERSUDRAFT_108718 [Gelatoporia subvermispora B]
MPHVLTVWGQFRQGMPVTHFASPQSRETGPKFLREVIQSPKARQDVLAILSGPEYHVSYADCLLLEQELDWRRERLESGNQHILYEL